MGKIPKNSVSLAGEFAVLSQLALRGYDANMTLGHTKSIDILVSDPKNNLMYQLEVKTASNAGRNGEPSRSKEFGLSFHWPMNKNHEQISRPNLFYCFVDLGGQTEKPRFFIVPSEVVSQYIKESHRLWLKSDKKHNDSNMRVFRIGFNKKDCKTQAPLAREYENNWEFKKIKRNCNCIDDGKHTTTKSKRAP